MTGENDNRRWEPLAWDRVGQFLQDAGAAAQEIAKRNQDLWGQVDTNLRGDNYTPEAMTRDAAKAVTIAMDNLDDIWQLLTRPPEHERVAATVPTVFLKFSAAGDHWRLPDPVWIRVPYWDRAALPKTADVYLDGDGDVVQSLKDSLPVTLHGKSYHLEIASPDKLTAGVYVGIVAIGDRPLANLRIVVEPRQP